MRIPGRKALRLPAAWLRSRLTDSAIILGYHRVAGAAIDPFQMCVSPDRFAEHLHAIQSLGEPIALSCLADGMRRGRVPANSIGITFDDGYADLPHAALPLLEQLGIPATVFVATGFIGEEFWWDSLERIILWPESLPGDACDVLERGGLAAGVTFSLPPPRVPRSLLRKRKGRRGAFLRLYRWLSVLPDAERRDAIRALSKLCGNSGETAEERSLSRGLRPDELRRIASSGLIELGAHTITHPLMAALPADMQRRELEGSKAHLEELIERSVVGFSYPHGSASPTLTALVSEIGFAYACGSPADVVWRGSALFELPRFWPGNWTGKRFSRWLSLLTNRR